MGRNREIGLSYFPFDVDTFSDIKIRKLIKYQGGKAVTIYALLLCLIYKSGYYMRWDEELPFVISEQTGFEEAYIFEVIKSCLALGLFSKELYESDMVLTSKGIQVRYAEAMKNFFRRKGEICEFSLISSEETNFSLEENGISSKKTPRKKKERKDKGEEKKETNFVGKENSPSPSSPVVSEKNYGGVVRNLRRPFEANVEECLQDQGWQEMVLINLSIRERIDFKKYFLEFRANIESHGEPTDKTREDFKRHFTSWLRIHYYEQNKQQNGKAYQEKMGRNDGPRDFDCLGKPRIAPAQIVPADRGKSCL